MSLSFTIGYKLSPLQSSFSLSAPLTTVNYLLRPLHDHGSQNIPGCNKHFFCVKTQVMTDKIVGERNHYPSVARTVKSKKEPTVLLINYRHIFRKNVPDRLGYDPLPPVFFSCHHSFGMVPI
jgi:hypothetical protein